MAVNHDVAALLAATAALGAPPIHACTPEQARSGFRARSVGTRPADAVVPVGSVTDRTVPGGDSDLGARVYRPGGSGTFPTVVFFHGGGFVFGDLDTHDNMARTLCRTAHCVVVSVDYRLSPEHPFPAAIEDAVAATTWIAAHLAEFGDDGTVSVAGDSAGGNLAAQVAQHLRDVVSAQLLIYPAVDPTGSYPSQIENAEGYLLEAATLDWFASHYLPAEDSRSDPRISLLGGSLAGLAPAVIVTAEHDPLRDEGAAYAEALREAGVPVDYLCAEGLIHGFFDLGHAVPSARSRVDEVCALFATAIRSASSI